MMEWIKALGWFALSYAFFGYVVTNFVNRTGAPGWLFTAEMTAYPIVILGWAYHKAASEAEQERKEKFCAEMRDVFAEMKRHMSDIRSICDDLQREEEAKPERKNGLDLGPGWDDLRSESQRIRKELADALRKPQA